MLFTIKIELFKGSKIFVSIGNLVDSPTHRYRESFFKYEFLREFEAKIGTARKVVQGTQAKAIYAKNSENSVHCHVPLRQILMNFDQKIFLFFLCLISLCVLYPRGSFVRTPHKNTKRCFLVFLLSVEALLEADPNEY